MDKFRKQPAEVLDYVVDASEWLPTADTIQSAVVIPTVYSGSETSPALAVDSYDISSDSVRVWLSGGTENIDYKVTVRMTTVGGRVKEHEFRIQIREA